MTRFIIRKKVARIVINQVITNYFKQYIYIIPGCEGMIFTGIKHYHSNHYWSKTIRLNEARKHKGIIKEAISDETDPEIRHRLWGT